MFVSPTGTATGAGTRESPLNSIDAAITMAVPEGGVTPKRVYVCAGTYNETIAINASRDKVKVFGGFRCADSDWAYTGELTKIAPSAQGVPLTLTGLTGALFADIEIDAQSAPQTPPDEASASGASSIAVLSNGATGVEFRRTKIVAGNGQPGADGALAPYPLPIAANLHGDAASGTVGGRAVSSGCVQGGGSVGGKGGDYPGGNGDPGLPALGKGTEGTAVQCAAHTANGSAGADAPAAAFGGGAQTPGAFAAEVWQPTAGAKGPRGQPGQGGGGGGAGDTSGGGGGGGAGGCGGAGGGGGGGGGASVPVVAIGSGVTLTASTLISAVAGNGGAGVPGQLALPDFGAGGLPDGTGCPGGHGGAGAAGGAGGGGAGGVSAGILYKGTAPTLDAATTSKFTLGRAGLKGSGGAPGMNDGPLGPSGIQVLGQ